MESSLFCCIIRFVVPPLLQSHIIFLAGFSVCVTRPYVTILKILPNMFVTKHYQYSYGRTCYTSVFKSVWRYTKNSYRRTSYISPLCANFFCYTPPPFVTNICDEHVWQMCVANLCDEHVWQTCVTNMCDKHVWQTCVTNIWRTNVS